MKKHYMAIILSIFLSTNCAQMYKLKASIENKYREYRVEREKKLLDICENNKRCVKAVKNDKIYIGMPEQALYESWGEPDHVNRTVNAYGEHEQYVYGDDIRNRIYVYLENGKITGWQD